MIMARIDLRTLQREAHAIAKEKGWWPPKCPECDKVTEWRQGDYYGTNPNEWYCDSCGIDVPSRHGYIEERTFGDLIALVHSELSEALEAYRERELEAYTPPDDVIGQPGKLGTTRQPHPFPGVGGYVNVKVSTKPEGVVYELADVVIRVADMAEWYEWKLPKRQLLAFDPNESFGEHIVSAHEMLSDVRGSEPTDVLSDFVEYIRAMAAHYGIDLDAAIEAKMEYSRGRSYRHGGKAL